MNINNGMILLSVQRALLGAITNNVRAVCVSYDQESISIYFYYLKKPMEEELEIAEIVFSEVICDFPGIVSTELKTVCLSFPLKIPNENLRVFHRQEEGWRVELRHKCKYHYGRIKIKS